MVANAAAQAFEYIGMPEGIYPIVEATLYLATAPKSNSASAYFAAQDKIEAEGAGPVPLHLMDPNRDAKGFGHGAGYDYPHSHPEHWTPQQYLPDGVVGTQFYHPGEQGYEAEVAERVRRWREAQAKALEEKKNFTDEKGKAK